MKRRHQKPRCMKLAFTLAIALMWLPLSHGELTPTPDEYDFGEVTVGDSSTTYITITNVGWRTAFTENVLIIVSPSASGYSTTTPHVTELQHSEPNRLVDVAGTLFFAADDTEHGMELWKSDGTPDGTMMVSDLWPGPDGSDPIMLTGCDGAVYFRCSLDATTTGLCRSDGTEAGTELIASILPTGSIWQSYMHCLDGTVYLRADDGVAGGELWRTDGTSEGTSLVADINPDGSSDPTELMSVNGILYFTARDEVHGRELWRSDGTSGGTFLLKDVIPGLAQSIPSHLTSFQEQLFFAAYDYDRGHELWKSDGTPAGTVLVKDVLPGNPDPSGRPVAQLTVIGDTLFFVTDDGTTGRELWKTDGSEEGTVRVRDILPGEVGSSPWYLTDVGGTLFFRASSDPEHPYLTSELWKSDGTEGGTVLVKLMGLPGMTGLTAADSTLFFQGRDELSGYELWMSDGTEEGTVMVRDIDPVDSSYPEELTVSNGTLFFVAHDPLYSREVFRSDGTYLGTYVVRDVRPGGDPSFEVDITFTPVAAGPAEGVLNVIGLENSFSVPLHGSGVAAEPTPSELIGEILTTFDISVADGSLAGSGPGGSADGRLTALRNMLVTAQGLIEAGDVEAACTQLLDAYNRTDGQPIPPDFVQGDAAPVIAVMILDLRTLLGCD